MMSEVEVALERKRKLCGAHRASATRLVGQAEALIAETSIDGNELALLQTSLSSKFTMLEALNKEIVELTPEDQLEEEVGRADDYAARIQKALLQIRKALKPTFPTLTVVPTATPPTVVTMGTPPTVVTTATTSTVAPTATPPTVVTTATTPGVVTTATPSTIMTTSTPSTVVTTATTPTATPLHSSSPVTSSKVKLPKISLPQFKGNPIYWTAFWDSYESAIHLNSTLLNVDKFNYLRSLLEKSAYEAIAGLTLSSANYIEAIEILKKRFRNKQMIVSKHMEILLSLTAVSGEHDLRGLR